LVIVFGRVVRENAVSGSIKQLSFCFSKIVILVEDHSGTALVCQKDQEVGIGPEGFGKVGLGVSGQDVEDEELKGLEGGELRLLSQAGFMELGEVGIIELRWKIQLFPAEAAGKLGNISIQAEVNSFSELTLFPFTLVPFLASFLARDPAVKLVPYTPAVCPSLALSPVSSILSTLMPHALPSPSSTPPAPSVMPSMWQRTVFH
jgi:hypothetical protein